MNKIKFIPTYRVINRNSIGRNKVKILLVNLANDFDVIEIKVPMNASGMVSDGNDYSITTVIKRSWYTLWLCKKKEYRVLGNINEDGQVLLTVTSASLSDKGIEDLKREWGEWQTLI